MSTARYSEKPDVLTVGETIVIIRDDIEQIEVPLPEEEGGGSETMWQCEETRLSHSEYEGLQKGQWEGPWTAATHKQFRQAQHDRTLGVYDLARRKAKTDDRWNAYIDALDAWNEVVSSLAATFSTDVPDLPAQPE
jgi:hypothetical protein